MRPRRLVRLAAFGAALAAGDGRAPASAQDGTAARARRAADSVAAALRSSDSVPGLSIVVARGGAVLVARGYGTADRATGAAAGPGTVYQIGSISKQFTAAGVMRLVEQGRLRLDDPVSRHLPEYRPRGDSVRLSHLLHQTSGIREEFTIPEYGALIGDTTQPNEELLALIRREPLGFRPGARWSYSNSNYALLAAVIDRAAGMPYDRFLREALFRPLGLASLHQCTNTPSAPDHARGYLLDGGALVPSPPENIEWTRGDGGLCASATDLARWARALATGRAVRAASYRRMTASGRLGDGTVPAYGFALSLVPLDGRERRVSHGGRMAGFTGTLAYYPDHDLAVAILANRGGVWIESAEQAIARAVLGRRAPALRRAALSAAERGRLVGTYDIGVVGLPVRVVDRDGRLHLEMPPPGPSSPLGWRVGRELAADLAPDAVRVLVPAGAGRADRIVLRFAGMHWYGTRVE